MIVSCSFFKSITTYIQLLRPLPILHTSTTSHTSTGGKMPNSCFGAGPTITRVRTGWGRFSFRLECKAFELGWGTLWFSQWYHTMLEFSSLQFQGMQWDALSLVVGWVKRNQARLG